MVSNTAITWVCRTVLQVSVLHADLDSFGYMHQIRNFPHIKRNNNQSKGTAYRMEKTFTSYSFEEGLTSRIYKKLRKLNTKE
jgi:hypothetical protein